MSAKDLCGEVCFLAYNTVGRLWGILDAGLLKGFRPPETCEPCLFCSIPGCHGTIHLLHHMVLP